MESDGDGVEILYDNNDIDVMYYQRYKIESGGGGGVLREQSLSEKKVFF